MSFQCPFYPKTFSSRNAYGQHVKFYKPPYEELDNILNVNDISLDEESFRNIEEVRNL